MEQMEQAETEGLAQPQPDVPKAVSAPHSAGTTSLQPVMEFLHPREDGSASMNQSNQTSSADHGDGVQRTFLGLFDPQWVGSSGPPPRLLQRFRSLVARVRVSAIGPIGMVISACAIIGLVSLTLVLWYCGGRRPKQDSRSPWMPTIQEPEHIQGPAIRRGSSAQWGSQASGLCPKLCHGLVVPPGSDCILAVQIPERRRKGRTVDILDLQGNGVLTAYIARPHMWSKVDLEVVRTMQWDLATHTPSIQLFAHESAKPDGSAGRPGKEPLAFCNEGILNGSEPRFFVFDGEGNCFGHVAKEHKQCYVFSTFGSSGLLNFTGQFSEHKVYINNRAVSLGETEPCSMASDPDNDYCCLRCCGTVDVGLVICCLLAIGEIEEYLHVLDQDVQKKRAPRR